MIRKKYSFKNNRTIWRLIPSGGKLLIEERNEADKEVFFSCIDIESGKSILKNYQPDEKFWTGVEAFEDDKIYFHGFTKPDMPGHRGIIVYDLAADKILWRREDLVFLFIYESRIYAFVQKFESREFYSLDEQTGEIVEKFGEDAEEINKLREKLLDEQYEKYKDYLFPGTYVQGKLPGNSEHLIENLKENEVISGSIDYVIYKKLLLLSFHNVNNDGKMNNAFRIIDIDSRKIIFEDVLNTGVTSYIPDSFFVKNNFLFLIRNKTELMVFTLM